MLKFWKMALIFAFMGPAIITSAIITSANAQSVFSVGTGEMPNPFFINPATDPDLNPAAGLAAMAPFTDRGAFAANTSYQAGDYITVGGVEYVVRSAMVSGASFASDITAGRFVLRGIASDSFYNGARFLSVGSYSNSGIWTTNTSYSIGDKVTHNGISYIASENHTSGVFAADSNAGYWVLEQTAPSLSKFLAPSPVGGICEDFDAVFNKGKGTYTIAMPFFKSDLNNTGTDLDGTLNISMTFDWENEDIAMAGDVALTSYPANKPGGGSFTIRDGSSDWTVFSFHTGGKCGHFKAAHSGGGYALPNQTCFSSTMISLYVDVQFYQKGSKFLPVAQIYPVSPSSYLNDFEFYNSIFNDNGCNANTKEHYGPAIGGSMEAK